MHRYIPVYIYIYDAHVWHSPASRQKESLDWMQHQVHNASHCQTMSDCCFWFPPQATHNGTTCTCDASTVPCLVYLNAWNQHFSIQTNLPIQTGLSFYFDRIWQPKTCHTRKRPWRGVQKLKDRSSEGQCSFGCQQCHWNRTAFLFLHAC